MFGLTISNGLAHTRTNQGVKVGARYWDHRLRCWVTRTAPDPQPAPTVQSRKGTPRDLMRRELAKGNITLAAGYLALEDRTPIHTPMEHTCEAPYA